MVKSVTNKFENNWFDRLSIKIKKVNVLNEIK